MLQLSHRLVGFSQRAKLLFQSGNFPGQARDLFWQSLDIGGKEFDAILGEIFDGIIAEIREPGVLFTFKLYSDAEFVLINLPGYALFFQPLRKSSPTARLFIN